MKFKSGQTLLEVLIAFAVTVLIGVGLVTAGLATQKAAAGAKNESQATKLAQEYIEKIRVIRDSKTWADFKQGALASNNDDFIINEANPYSVSTWSFTNSWVASSPCSANIGGSSLPMEGQKITINNTDFCRKVKVSNNSSSALSMTFTVEVGWMEGNNTRSSKAETTISKWCGSTITGLGPTPCP